MLAKAYLFQQKFAQAKPLLDSIYIRGGFSLMPRYSENFRAATNNNAESIFEVEHSVNGGAGGGENGNQGVTLNYPYGGPTTCCAASSASQNMVNALKQTPSGLPMLDTFNDTDVKNDQGLEST